MGLIKKTESKINSMAEAVRVVIDKYSNGHEFHGSELHRDVVRIYPLARWMYTDTLLRRLREWRRLQVKCINPNKSLYKKIKGGKE